MDFLVHHALEITVVETWDSNAYSERLKPFMFKKKQGIMVVEVCFV